MTPAGGRFSGLTGHAAALVTDLDDSLLDSGRPDGRKATVILRRDTLAAVDGYLAEGGRLIIDTGRRRSDFLPLPGPRLSRDPEHPGVIHALGPGEELQPLVPELTRRADAVVMEMGAVVWFPAENRVLRLPPGDDQHTWNARLQGLYRELRREGVPDDVLWVGDRVLSTKAGYAAHVNRALTKLGLTGTMSPVVNNPDADLSNPEAPLNVCPAGVTKATGLRVALGAFQLSPAQVTGFGNSFYSDWPFLEICGARVAPANADALLKARVDLVTRGRRGAGGTELLRGLSRALQLAGPGENRHQGIA